MTRIEIFSDAAFAFAVTMLVVSLSAIPKNYTELIEAMKGVPAFAACFAQIMAFWLAHRRWSRCFGLDDGKSTFLTLGMIFIILVYVYPLKLMMTAAFAFFTGGWLPSEFVIGSAGEMCGVVVLYGVGVALLSGVLGLLYLHSESESESLNLNPLERLYTRSELVLWSVHGGVGFLSAAFAFLMPASIGVNGGYFYFLLPLVLPLVGIYFGRKRKALTG